MAFDQRKGEVLRSLSCQGDNSRKGSVDAPIFDLIAKINSHSNLCTTSSCSGRISVFAEPDKQTRAQGLKGGAWVFASHEEVNYDKLLKSVLPEISAYDALVFRFEPFILAADCRDMATAQQLVSCAQGCGFRESGVTGSRRYIAGLRCSLRLEVPISSNGKLLVPEAYLRFLVDNANAKMQANLQRIAKFKAAIEQQFLQPVQHSQPAASDGHIEDPFLPLSAEHTSKLSAQQLKELKARQKSVLGRITQTQNRLEKHEYCTLPSPCPQWQPVGDKGACADALKRWGHSAVAHGNNAIIFGGFGGGSTHARLNNVVLIDINAWTFVHPEVHGMVPAARTMHAAAVIGERMLIFGGRTSPTQPLADTWALHLGSMHWQKLQAHGPCARYRHSAVGTQTSMLLVFGGTDGISSFDDVWAFDSQQNDWQRWACSGAGPCARHSHAAAMCGQHMFVHGGKSAVGQRLADVHTLDTQRQVWTEVDTTGSPCVFSHAIVACQGMLIVAGGCPHSHAGWLHCMEISIGRWHVVQAQACSTREPLLLVRHAMVAAGSNLLIAGGGAICFGFGTAFSPPVRVSLQQLLQDWHASSNVLSQPASSGTSQNQGAVQPMTEANRQIKSTSSGITASCASNKARTCWALQVPARQGKAAKDALASLQWLDRSQRTQQSVHALQGPCVSLPLVSAGAASLLAVLQVGRADSDELSAAAEAQQALAQADAQPQPGCKAEAQTGSSQSINAECAGVLYSLDQHGAAGQRQLALQLRTLGAQLVKVQQLVHRKQPQSPAQVLLSAMTVHLQNTGVAEHAQSALLQELPSRWERLGDLVLLPADAMTSSMWHEHEPAVWQVMAAALQCRRIARQARIAPTGTRDSQVKLLLGADSWVTHRENGIIYSLDVCKCMFSSGNVTEKARMGRLQCHGETIVDLFAGIGYYTLPLLVHAGAACVIACEWNPAAVHALQRNLEANHVVSRCQVQQGDCRHRAPQGAADRVVLGLIPSSSIGWLAAVSALKPAGGWLHVHGNVNVKVQKAQAWAGDVCNALLELASAQGRHWVANMKHVERVKSYAPHTFHCVADIECTAVSMMRA